jgi:LysM repeat protein
VIARACRVQESVIFELNPHLLQECAPDGKSSYAVRIPEGKLETCRSELENLPREQRIATVFPSPNVKHKVRRGETLSRIAEDYGTTISAIAGANGIRNYHKIRAGQVLLIPGEGYVRLPDNPGVHTVRKGETLSGIGEKYGVKVRELAAWNNLRSRHLIYPGQRLVISLDGLPAERTVMHTVKQGDTISRIARSYKASVRAVLAANHLEPNDPIYPGQKIEVPVTADAVPGDRILVHTVSKGETVTEIARKHGASTDAVLKTNGLGPDEPIYPGQEILVALSAGEIAPGEIVIHKVKEGETLWGIARKYAASLNRVREMNGLSGSDTIYPGQRLAITASKPSWDKTIEYTVNRGDTISGIAKKYGVSVKSLLETNSRRAKDIIYPGQIIRIPVR